MKFYISKYIIKTLILLDLTLFLSGLKFNSFNNMYSFKFFLVKVIIVNIAIYVTLLIIISILNKINIGGKKSTEFEKEAGKAFNLINQCTNNYPNNKIKPKNSYMYDLKKTLNYTYLDEIDQKKAIEYYEYLEWLEQNLHTINNADVQKRLAFFEKYFTDLISNNVYR